MATRRIVSKSTGNPFNLQPIINITTIPPAAVVGDRYLVEVGAIGVWSGWDDSIAEYNSDGTWSRMFPQEAFVVRNDATEVPYIYLSGAWEEYHNISGSVIAGLAGRGLIPGGTDGSLDVNVDEVTLTIGPGTGGDYVLIKNRGVSGQQLSTAMNPAYEGTFYQGYADGASTLASTAAGSFAQGYVKNADITASSKGSFAQGYGNNGNVQATANGSSAQGYVKSISDITASGKGSFAQGYVKSSSDIAASANGSFAQGYVYSGYIRATGIGSFAQGRVSDGYIKASGIGSFAQGYGCHYGYIQASGKGASAQGYAYYSGYIQATANGSFAHGYANGRTIAASGAGSFAHGLATGGDITASGVGSLALGYANAGSIEAIDDNTIQLGVGINSFPGSIQVESGIKVLGDTPPDGGSAYPYENGQIWMTGTYVYVRSGGNTVKIA